MKKFISVLLSLSFLISVCSCGSKKNKSDTVSNSTEGTAVQPDPLEKKYATTAPSESEESTSVQTETAVTSTTVPSAGTTSEKTTESTTVIISDNDSQPDPMGAGVLNRNDDGSISIEGNEVPEDERSLIAMAQAVFENACRTEWNFTVGCPYSIDMSDTAQNSIGWTLYRITDNNIHSFQDVLNDYHRVFSDRYENSDLEMLYTEKNGSVYAMNGQRGSDLYYTTSKITEIQSRSDDEIFFTVENYYDGSDIDGSALRTDTDTFSVVIESDGTVKAGKFRLPY